MAHGSDLPDPHSFNDFYLVIYFFQKATGVKIIGTPSNLPLVNKIK